MNEESFVPLFVVFHLECSYALSKQGKQTSDEIYKIASSSQIDLENQAFSLSVYELIAAFDLTKEPDPLVEHVPITDRPRRWREF